MKNIFLVLLFGILIGCQASNPVVQKTSLEIQAIQARNFETDKK